MYMYDDFYFGEPEPNPPKKGGFGDWLKKTGKGLGDFISGGGADNALGTVNNVLCTINPRRPGCNPEPIYVQRQQTSAWLILSIIVVIALVIFFIIKKKK